ncbi:MAG: polynucleotide kinase-phosphatase [Planctomycetota bacterium]
MARNKTRPERAGSQRYVLAQYKSLRRELGRSQRGRLEREGFRYVHLLASESAALEATIERQPLWSDRREECGPFDCIGDVHGCYDELVELLQLLEYRDSDGVWSHKEGRRAIFVGDLVDRGPRSLDCLRLVARMVEKGNAFCVPGNHDVKLMRALNRARVRVSHGLERTLAEFDALPADQREAEKGAAAEFINSLVGHLVLDRGKLVVAHAGMKQSMQGRGSAAVREFALYGETTGEVDSYGLPVRYNWAAEYRGDAIVVYGHTPVLEAEWLNKTICIDTGCVFGGSLTALRYPEMELTSVPAAAVYYEPIRPLGNVERRLSTQHEDDETLDIGDIYGKRVLTTRLIPSIIVSAGESAAALETMSRFAVNPKWLIYLPPTMSPRETSLRADFLEYPTEAFQYYRAGGVPSVLCEEKHMGSQAVLIVCRDETVARRRFGIDGAGAGIIYTRTGRRFFEDRELEVALIDRVRHAAESADWWKRFATDWFALDAELMPWSAKAQALLRHQYAAVGRSASEALADLCAVTDQAEAAGRSLDGLAARARERRACVDAFIAAYRRYCWHVGGLEDLRLAPFHLLAAECGTFVDKDHGWHLATLAELANSAGAAPVLMATQSLRVDLADPKSEALATDWWLELTTQGGEGMVVKPFNFIARGRRGILQPSIKCRGREYLRIIYGAEYTRPEQLERLRSRGLGHKRSLAAREFALGIEALERFAKREPCAACTSACSAF